MPVALIVEDDENIRTLFKDALEGIGFTPLVSSGVREALILLEKHIPDIAFIDLNMPGRPGTDVLTYLKETPRFANTKTVVVTAQTRMESKVEEIGADLFMAKPVSIHEMMTLARRLLV